MTSRLPSVSLNHAALWSITQAMLDYISGPLDYPPGFSGQPNPQQQQAAADARLRGVMLLALASTDYQVS